MSITNHFYHETLRKYIIGFGTLFNGMRVSRDNDEFITVPIAYGSKQKWMARLQQNPDLKKAQAVNLPRMSFLITNIMYDAERKTSSTGNMARINRSNNKMAKKIFHPSPYNIDISLTIFAKNMEDYLQILEQILPFFKPEYNLSIVDIDGIDVLKDIPIVLNDIGVIHDSEGGMDEFRVINSDLNFTVKGSFYGPFEDKPLITKCIINTRLGDAKFDDPDADVDTRQHTEVDPQTAFADDDYGFLTYTEMYPKDD